MSRHPQAARLYLVRGRVQGVGYRDYAQRMADALGVTGYVAIWTMDASKYTPPGRPINFPIWPRRSAKARVSPTCAASTSRRPRPSTIPIFKSRSDG